MRSKRIGVLSAIGLVGGLVGLVSVPAASAQPVEETFSYNGTTGADGSPQSFTVPASVCRVTVTAFGAQGGDASEEGSGIGGLGGGATATIEVNPGDELMVRVGGQGLTGNPGTGGFNGGGDGASTDSVAGGGGGASDVRVGGDDLDHRRVAAGGGGGGAVFGEAELPGGGGGGAIGADGAGHAGDLNGGGGGGGSQSAGGTGGAGGVGDTPGGDGEPGQPGQAGQGGAGGLGVLPAQDAAGGGGGFFGGGGGGGGGVNEQQELFGGGGSGGGGSGFTPDGTGLTTGVREGHGEVTISYDPVADACPPPEPAAPVAAAPRFTG